MIVIPSRVTAQCLHTAARSSSVSGEPCRACWKGFNVALFTLALANTFPRKLVADISTDDRAAMAAGSIFSCAPCQHCSGAVIHPCYKDLPTATERQDQEVLCRQPAHAVLKECKQKGGVRSVPGRLVSISHPRARYLCRLRTPDLCKQQPPRSCTAEDLNDTVGQVVELLSVNSPQTHTPQYLCSGFVRVHPKGLAQ